MDPLVSVIVPIYNTQEYLEQCINSVCHQTYDNIEIILVNDGSADSSGRLCDAAAQQDRRIKVVHKKVNEGLVRARKDGLGVSCGEYVIPLDSDDWIDEKYVERLVGKAIAYDCDVVQCGIIYEREDGNATIGNDIIGNGYYDLADKDNELYKSFFVDKSDWTRRGLRCNLWSCVFRRNIMLDSQMRIPDTLANGEDDAAYFAALLLSKTFYKIDDAIYHCRIRNGSMSRNRKLYNVSQVLQIDGVIRPLVEKHIAYTRIMPQWDAYMLYLFNYYARQMWGFGYIPQYAFPYEIVPQNSRLVVYGAGMVGKSYVAQVDSGNYVQLVGWIDKRYGWSCYGQEVQGIEKLNVWEFDYILIAVSSDSIMESIREQLVDFGVENSKVLWTKPIYLKKMYYFSNKNG